MGLFDNLFGKKTCTLCGAECGPMHRTKIKNKEFVCSDCARKCSAYARLSEMDKQRVQEHIAFMEQREKVYRQYQGSTKLYPSTVKKQGILFCDDIGMLVIRSSGDGKNKETHEVIRYDEIASYEYYRDTTKTEDGKEQFKADGVVLRLLSPLKQTDDTNQKGLRAHPYIKQDIKLCFRTSENDTNYADNALQHLDWIFGVHDSERGLFSFGASKAQKRELQAQADMGKLMGSIIKGSVKGEMDPTDPALQAQFEKASKSIDDAQTGGLAEYTRRSDEAESSVESQL